MTELAVSVIGLLGSVVASWFAAAAIASFLYSSPVAANRIPQDGGVSINLNRRVKDPRTSTRQLGIS